ncbi:short-chain dehydrogenase [Vibrio navarrensis]|nr:MULTISPECIES: SDR family oxidoreductase [Vibrio]KJR36130.1 short-chain dehydrogenase [Vibrio sp. S234-5]MBE3663327.1 short-chain dehydrogenase [Vibrio navarrensis]MBE4603472.1 short-chain dehydrogenase [Vibrio navarrensis]
MNVVIFGATSAIAEEIAKCYVSKAEHIILLARNEDKLEMIANDLKVRGANAVSTLYFSALEYTQHIELVNEVFSMADKIDVCVIAHGSLPSQEACQNDVEITLKEIAINGTSVISLLTLLANRFEKQGSGSIVVISSVAGDRGRQSNYVYGAAKGMVSTFLQGLAQRLSKNDVHILDIKPGFVDTPMTELFVKGILWSKPSQVAKTIVKRIDCRSRRNYVPGFWQLIMFVIKVIPQSIFNKIKL